VVVRLSAVIVVEVDARVQLEGRRLDPRVFEGDGGVPVEGDAVASEAPERLVREERVDAEQAAVVVVLHVEGDDVVLACQRVGVAMAGPQHVVRAQT